MALKAHVLMAVALVAAHVARIAAGDASAEAALAAFGEAARAAPEIAECHMIAGGFDYVLKVRTRDIADYRRVLGETISALPHVSHTSTFVVMETVKEG